MVNLSFHHCTSRENNAGTNIVEDWLGPRAGSNVLETRKKLSSVMGFESRIVQFAASSLYRVRSPELITVNIKALLHRQYRKKLLYYVSLTVTENTAKRLEAY